MDVKVLVYILIAIIVYLLIKNYGLFTQLPTPGGGVLFP